MGHGAHLSKEYRDLAGRLQHGTVALVEPANPAARAAWQEILETLFSPADAALAAKLPVLPTPLEGIAKRLGLERETLRRQLDEMADKGLVMDVADPRTGETVYMLAPPVVGFFEFSMMRLADHLPKAKLAEAYTAYAHDEDFLKEVSGGDTVIGRTMVHETALFEDLLPQVLDWERASACIEEAGKVGLTNCYCRHKARHLGTACDYPMETCMSLGGGADYLVRHGLAREISREEGLELLVAAREAGLVHMADNVQQDPVYICSCCSCCCEALRSVRVGHGMVVPSGFRPAVDAATCTGCGRCVRACPIQAFSLVARTTASVEGEASKRLLARVDYDRCLGCAVCVGSCRHDSLQMQRRSEQRHVPLNIMEFITRAMIERGRVADLLVDGAAGRGPAFANAVLSAILSLPPAERLLAKEQVRSRFVQMALSKS